MADVKISALPAAGTLTSADVLPLVQGASTTKVSLTQLDTRWVASGTGGGQNTSGLVVSPYIAVGTPNPAQSGVVRIPNAQYVQSRNAANSADILLIGAGPGGSVAVGSVGAAGVTIGNATTGVHCPFILNVGPTPANSGHLRMTNDTYIYSRNAANSADVAVLGVTTSNAVRLGGVNNTGITLGAAGVPVNVPFTLSVGTNFATSGALGLANGAGSAINFRNAANTANLSGVYMGSNDVLELGGAGQSVHIGGNGLGLGTNPAAAGIVRIPNDQAITARNAANNADVPMLKVSPTNKVQAWNGTAWADIGTGTPAPTTVSRWVAVNPNIVANTPQDITLTTFTMPFAGQVQMQGQVNCSVGGGASALEIIISGDLTASVPAPSGSVAGAGGSMPANLYLASFPIGATWSLAAGASLTIKVRVSSSAGAAMGAVINAMSALIIVTSNGF